MGAAFHGAPAELRINKRKQWQKCKENRRTAKSARAVKAVVEGPVAGGRAGRIVDRRATAGKAARAARVLAGIGAIAVTVAIADASRGRPRSISRSS
jgi:hypothetical protein